MQSRPLRRLTSARHTWGTATSLAGRRRLSHFRPEENLVYDSDSVTISLALTLYFALALSLSISLLTPFLYVLCLTLALPRMLALSPAPALTHRRSIVHVVAAVAKVRRRGRRGAGGKAFRLARRLPRRKCDCELIVNCLCAVHDAQMLTRSADCHLSFPC